MDELFILEVGDGKELLRVAHIGNREQCVKFAEEYCSLFDNVERSRDVGQQAMWGNGQNKWIAMINPISHYQDPTWFAQHIRMRTTINEMRRAADTKMRTAHAYS